MGSSSGRRNAALLVLLIFMALCMVECSGKSTTLAELIPTTDHAVSTPDIIESPGPATDSAQATIQAGQAQLLDLARTSTAVSQAMTQSANAALRTTEAYGQLQQLDLASQATLTSLNITQAVATQHFVVQQTRSAAGAILQLIATQTAQAQNFQATQVAQVQKIQIAETSQAQAIMNTLLLQANQTAVALTAYPLTATPYAATQAAGVIQEYNREQDAFLNQVVNPLIPILAFLVLMVFIMAIVAVYRRYMSIPRERRPLLLRRPVDNASLMMIEGMMVDAPRRLQPLITSDPFPVTPSEQPPENTVHVEIVDPAEAPVAHWIEEAENKLSNEDDGEKENL